MFKAKLISAAVLAALPLFITGCNDGDDGNDGAPGAPGADGSNGLTSLVSQLPLEAGNAHCPNGGVRIDSGMDLDGDGVLAADEVTDTNYVCTPNAGKVFNRIATYPVCRQIDAACDNDVETVSEIVAASDDGLTLVYTDSPQDRIGFVDITDPGDPQGLGTLAMGGEPTSVAVRGDHALVGVNSSADYVNTAGSLTVVDIASRSVVRSIDVGGQPDSVAVSPDKRYAVIVIENERDEDLGDGAPPQLPAGRLVIVDLVGAPAAWTTRNVDLTGLADLYAGDPEPEYVDINADNVAVVTLQENNYIVLVDLTDGSIVNHFSAGTVDLAAIDATEEDVPVISLTETQENVPREPDGVSWISSEYFATADEGDLNGGSRGFTVFNTAGEAVFQAGNALDHLTVRLGHYPEARSGNKGNEPENAEYGNFDGDKYLFIASERSSLVFVYDVADPANPIYKQTLPAATGPEGILAIPSRNLLIAASEEDNRDDKMRGGLNIYRYGVATADYPTIASVNDATGNPIPWSALSGLAADPLDPTRVYSIEDSFYGHNRIFSLDVSKKPAQLVAATPIRDANGVFAATSAVALADPGVDADDATRAEVFDQADLAAMINADLSVNIDPEGIAKASDGGFWVASEGSGTVGDAKRPINSLNFLFKTDATGVIEQVIRLPDEVNAMQLRFGFEGVAEDNGKVYVAFQRAWGDEANPRIGIYDTVGADWSFVYYPLDAVASQNGGWVGLSDLTALGNGRFLVLERDNQGGPDAAIKRLYTIDLSAAAAGSTVSKTLVRDLMPDLAATNGPIPEKIEGSAVLADGDVLIVNDNDGVDDSNGATFLINLGPILQ